MVSNEDITKRMEVVRRGFDPDTGLERLSKMERPLKWVDNACIINLIIGRLKIYPLLSKICLKVLIIA